MRLIILILAGFAFSAHAIANDGGQSSIKTERPKISALKKFESRSVGHLVTPNNTLMNQGEIGAGTLYAAYAFTDNFNMGVSPFAYLGFGMYNIMGRYARDISDTERLGFDFAYFKTRDDEEAQNNYTESGFYNFKMEAWDTKLTYNNLLTPWYRLNISTSFYYYIDDTRPFSLRMDPGRANVPYAINLTSLHELRFSKNVFVNLEGGFWGLNYLYPYYHVGASLNLQDTWLLLGFGVSTTFSPSFPAEKSKRFAGYSSPQSIHPELQIQAFF